MILFILKCKISFNKVNNNHSRQSMPASVAYGLPSSVIKFIITHVHHDLVVEAEYTITEDWTAIMVEYFHTEIAVIGGDIATISSRSSVQSSSMNLERFMQHLDRRNALSDYVFGPFRCSSDVSESHRNTKNAILSGMQESAALHESH